MRLLTNENVYGLLCLSHVMACCCWHQIMPDHHKQDYCCVAAADAAVLPSMLWLAVAGTIHLCPLGRISVVRLLQLPL